MPDHTVAAILDGHAGDQTALYASTRLLHVIEETEQVCIHYFFLRDSCGHE